MQAGGRVRLFRQFDQGTALVYLGIECSWQDGSELQYLARPEHNSKCLVQANAGGEKKTVSSSNNQPLTKKRHAERAALDTSNQS